jgi:hypothetical protein
MQPAAARGCFGSESVIPVTYARSPLLCGSESPAAQAVKSKNIKIEPTTLAPATQDWPATVAFPASRVAQISRVHSLRVIS